MDTHSTWFRTITVQSDPVHRHLNDDTFLHVLSFLDEADFIEWTHVHPMWERLIRFHYPHVLYSPNMCRRCKHHHARCVCTRNDKYIVKSCVVIACLIPVVSISLAILSYHRLM